MGITDIDPIQNELLFERFLNPERVSMPDIDVDFCMNRRGEVINYVTEKYGREQVAQIITFGTLAAKAAIKDTGRVLDMPYDEVDRIAKMIPGTPGMTIDKAMADVQAFQDVYTNDPAIRNLVDTAKKLEGMVRNSGVHASAVVIAPVPLDELVPLYKTKNDEIVTAYDMTAVEKMGLLKMDFLGLTTLTIIDDCLKLIQTTRGETVEMEKIPLEDVETYEKVFHKGQTSGVFQFESDGMRDVLRRYQPTTVEDLTALNALYRPGPIQGGMIDDFIERKWGRKKVDYMLPELERLLKETLGVIVYQEQVMQIANVLAGYSLGEADLLRRAMGKKIAAEMDKQRERFMQGAAERKFPAEKAGHIFDLMAEFAGYGFNKSHSAAYALVAYHTAYLKTHYPVEFMAALLTSVTGKTEDVVKYIGESREMGIEVLAPDVHESAANFTPIRLRRRRSQDSLRLSAVKNVGSNAITSIVEARQARAVQGDLRFLRAGGFAAAEQAGAGVADQERGDGFAGRRGAADGRRWTRRWSRRRRRRATARRDSTDCSASSRRRAPAAAAADRLPNVPDWDETRTAGQREGDSGLLDQRTSAGEIPGEDRGPARPEDQRRAGHEALDGEERGHRGGRTDYGSARRQDSQGRPDGRAGAGRHARAGGGGGVSGGLQAAGGEGEAGGSGAGEGGGAGGGGCGAQAVHQRDYAAGGSQGEAAALGADHDPAGRGAGRRRWMRCMVSLPGARARPRCCLIWSGAGEYLVVMEAEGYNVSADRAFLKSVSELCGPDSVKIID